MARKLAMIGLTSLLAAFGALRAEEIHPRAPFFVLTRPPVPLSRLCPPSTEG